MTEVHHQQIQWHDPSCSSVDVIQTPTFLACLSCGSSGPPPPPALHLPLPDDTSIRLLALLSGDFDDPIKCHLRVCSLSSTLNFNAISYSWADENGDDRKCEKIILDGQPFQVSRNCHMALKRVRQVARTAAIWVDAICIDQCNTEERGHQVKLMSQIYLRAHKVFVYVGEHHNGSRNLLDIIGRLSQSQGLDRPETLLGLISESTWNSFFARRYFSRLWILQELALGKHAIVLCGDSSLAWDHLANYSRAMMKFHKIKENPIFMFERSLYLSPNKELLLLDQGRQAHATDPRDKVYGLLGLMPAQRLGSIVADYTLSVEQLYIKVALEIAKLYGRKAVLDRAGRERQRISSLPSWVPDWSFTGDIQMDTPNSEPLQSHVVDTTHIDLKLIKHPSSDENWLLLDEAIGHRHGYFFSGLKSKFYHHVLLERFETRNKMMSPSRALYLSLSAPPSSDKMPRSLCTTMGVVDDQSAYMCLADAVCAFPLTMRELVVCATDKYTLYLHGLDPDEASLSPSLFLDSLLGAYLRLSAAGPVEDWVLEAEELWVERYGRDRSSILIEVDDELYTANDAFWRLLVRRFALKEQTVYIA